MEADEDGQREAERDGSSAKGVGRTGGEEKL